MSGQPCGLWAVFVMGNLCGNIVLPVLLLHLVISLVPLESHLPQVRETGEMGMEVVCGTAACVGAGKGGDR